MPSQQLGLFDSAVSAADPQGFLYAAEVIDEATEASLVTGIQGLTLKEFEFRGYKGKRRVASFGWRYDFNDGSVTKADDLPDFLLALRQTAAASVGLEPETLQQALVTEYAPGAGIGWHRDRPIFGDVIGISLMAPCHFRLRRRSGVQWERRSFTASPRSAYRLSGPVRWEWEHSIPPVDDLRYSITYRSFK